MLEKVNNIAIFGTSGALGSALKMYLSQKYPNATIHGFSRNTDNLINYNDETAIQDAANFAARENPLDLVLVTNGILHNTNLQPEKSIKDISREKFQQIYEVNVIIPALIAKYFLPKLNKDQTSIFSAFSARVGSISDNRIGGWYAYRSSKAALNMIIKNASIEISRTNKQAIIIGLHPGTVDSELSKPFQKNINKTQLFTPQYSAQRLINVIENLTPEQSGKCFAWDGKEIFP